MLIKVHCAYQLGQEEAELGLSVCLVAIVMLVLAACCCIQDSKQLLLQFCQHAKNISSMLSTFVHSNLHHAHQYFIPDILRLDAWSCSEAAAHGVCRCV